MHKVLFICHGNICRSPMAEFILKHLADEQGRAAEFIIDSAAVSTEEIGNDIYPPAKRKLREKNVPFSSRQARQMTKSDYLYYDHIVCMDRSNLRWMKYIIGDDNLGNVSLLMNWLDTTENTHTDVADPWYTGDFEVTYNDILSGCKAILNQLT